MQQTAKKPYPFASPGNARNHLKTHCFCAPSLAKETTALESLTVSRKPWKSLGKLIIPTSRPCGLPQAALGVPCWPAQNRVGSHWKPLGKQTFLAVPAWWSTMAPAQALARLRKSYGFRESFKILGNTNKSLTAGQATKHACFPSILLRHWET